MDLRGLFAFRGTVLRSVHKLDVEAYHYIGALWAGQARSAQEIRTHLASRLPAVPSALIACLEPAEWFLPSTR